MKDDKKSNLVTVAVILIVITFALLVFLMVTNTSDDEDNSITTSSSSAQQTEPVEFSVDSNTDLLLNSDWDKIENTDDTPHGWEDASFAITKNDGEYFYAYESKITEPVHFVWTYQIENGKIVLNSSGMVECGGGDLKCDTSDNHTHIAIVPAKNSGLQYLYIEETPQESVKLEQLEGIVAGLSIN